MSADLGSYFHENYATTYPLTVPRLAQTDGVWKQIEVGGVSMHDAIARWWNDTGTAAADGGSGGAGGGGDHWYEDGVW